MQNGSVMTASHLPAWKALALLNPVLQKTGFHSGKPRLEKTYFSPFVFPPFPPPPVKRFHPSAGFLSTCPFSRVKKGFPFSGKVCMQGLEQNR